MTIRRATAADAAWIAPIYAATISALDVRRGAPPRPPPAEPDVLTILATPLSQSWVNDVQHYWCHLDHWLDGPIGEAIQVSYLLPGAGQRTSTRLGLLRLLARALLAMDATLPPLPAKNLPLYANLDEDIAFAHWKTIFTGATVTPYGGGRGGRITWPRDRVMARARLV